MDIEKAKEKLKNPNKKNLIDVIRIFKRNGIENYCIAEIETIQVVLSELEKKDEYIKMLTDEREHIKNNLKVDLKRKGVFSQAKGQIAQILEYYENNEKYFNKVEKEGIKE